MKTVGNLIKEARLLKNVSREKLGEMTHIKVSFIKALENGDWGNLPEFNIILGFVKSIAHFLDMDERQAVSIFRREYPPELIDSVGLKGLQNDKGVIKKFIWGPRFTFLTGVLVIVFVVILYLGFQFRKFNAAPTLIVTEPLAGQIVNGLTLGVVGKTDPDVTLDIDNQPIVVNSNGSFSAEIDISKDTKQVTLKAKSRSGKVTIVSRTIKVKP